MKIMAANSNLPLARAIAGYLELPLVDAQVRRFADEERVSGRHSNVGRTYVSRCILTSISKFGKAGSDISYKCCNFVSTVHRLV